MSNDVHINVAIVAYPSREEEETMQHEPHEMVTGEGGIAEGRCR
jgi:hypothetical protein